MLLPEYLDRVADDIVELYSAFELSVLEDIVRRLNKMNYLTPTAEFQLQVLRESGFVYQNIVDEIARLSGKSVEEVNVAFESSSLKSLRFDDSIYKSAGLSPISLKDNTIMKQLIAANAIKTNGELLNLTRTSALQGQQLFITAASKAQLQVESGLFSVDKAINSAVKDVSKEGLTVLYPTGVVRSVESAVRSNVMTGVNQTAAKLSEMRAQELGIKHYETSAHAGARNTGIGPENHESWQGKVFLIDGSSKKYPNFKEATGYGTVTGLAGANCRHSFYGIPIGAPRAYDRTLLEKYKNQDVTYNGKTMSYYEATQKQRYYETQIRRWKTEAKLMEAAGQDSAFAKAKVRQWQSKTRDLVEQTGVRRQYTREKIA